MKPICLGINNDSIQYEVALEILGQELQPLIRTIGEEKGKASPSAALIKYCEMRQAAINELQHSLRVEDRDTIERILDTEDCLFRTPRLKAKS